MARSTNDDTLGGSRAYATIAAPLADLAAVVGDVDRTGRDDVILARRTAPDQLSLMVLQSTWNSRFVARTWWSSPVPFSWAASQLAVADLNGDGRADVVVYRDAAPAAGTDAYRFLSTGSNFRESLWRAMPALDWGSLQAF